MMSSMASASQSSSSNHHCGLCGSLTGHLSRCSACKEVWYCSKEHQRADWKSHQHLCRYVKDHPQAVCIKVEEGEGNGLDNTLKNYVFDNKAQGLVFAAGQLGGSMSQPLASPFAEMLGWKLEVHCSTIENKISLAAGDAVQAYGHGTSALNSAGIYLGCNVLSGLSHYTNLRGDIFVFGRRIKDGKSIVSDSLRGILNFISDAMPLYPENPQPTLVQWAQQYHDQSWLPQEGRERAVYCVDVHQSKDRVEFPTTSTTPPQQRQATQPSGHQPPNNIPDAVCQKIAGALVHALRSDLYPDEASEKVWGIEMSNDGSMHLEDMTLGAIVYNVYQEIFKRRLFHAGESVYDSSPGPACQQFTSDLSNALKFWTLPGDFEEWTRQVVDDEEFPLCAYSTEMKRRGFFTEQNLVNPHLEDHWNYMKWFTGKVDISLP